MRQEAVVLVEYFFGHAIDAAEIAAVSDRNAQVVQWTHQCIGKKAGRCLQQRGNGSNAADRAFVKDGDDALIHTRYDSTRREIRQCTEPISATRHSV